MDIYIDDYVDYILYHPEHVYAVGYPDEVMDEATTKFNNIMRQITSNGLADYYNSIISSTRAKSGNAAASLNVLSSLTSGTTLDDILNQIAQSINQGIETATRQAANLSYDEIQNQARSFSRAMNSGPMSSQAVNEFFDLIIQGMGLAAQIDATTLDQLTNIGQNLTNNPDFAIPREWYNRVTVVELSPQDAQVAERVITYLDNAANKLRRGGRLSPSSFATTITNIFSQALRQPLSQSLLAKGIQAGIADIEQTMANHAARDVNMTLQFAPINKPTSAGRNQRLFNSSTFDVTVTEGDQNFNIGLSVNSNVKWIRGASTDSKVNFLERASGAPLSPYLDVRGANILTHRLSFDAEWNALQASTAASFFMDIFSNNSTLNAQFIMFNDKVYPVLTIIRRICEELLSTGRSRAFSISGIEGVQNQWRGQQGRPNAYLAQARSNAINRVINTLTIAATLNTNILTQYIT